MDENKGGGLGFGEVCAQPLQLIFGDVTRIAALVVGGAVVSIENDEMNPSQVERVVSARHAPPIHCVLSTVTAVGVVVPQNMVSGSGKGVPDVQETLVGFLGDAEVAQLDDKIDLFGRHLSNEHLQPMVGVMHDVFVNVSNDPESNRFGVGIRIARLDRPGSQEGAGGAASGQMSERGAPGEFGRFALGVHGMGFSTIEPSWVSVIPMLPAGIVVVVSWPSGQRTQIDWGSSRRGSSGTSVFCDQ